MSHGPYEQLERQLRDSVAARRGAAGRRARHWPARPRAATLALGAVSLAVVVVVAIVVISSAGHRPNRTRAGTHDVAAIEQLAKSQYAVFARPQTTKDRSLAAVLSRAVHNGGLGSASGPATVLHGAIPGLTRYAETLPGGREIFLVVLRRSSSQRRTGHGRRAAQQMLVVRTVVVAPDGGFIDGPPVQSVGGAESPAADLTVARVGRQACLGYVYVGIVPNQVTRIRWQLARQDSQGYVFPSALTDVIPVRNNVAATVIRARPSCERPSVITLFGRHGHVLSTHGDPGDLNRITRPARTWTPPSNSGRRPTKVPKPPWERLEVSRAALIAELAPLRRRQTPAEHAFARTLDQHQAAFEDLDGSPDRSLVRYATTTPWGQRMYLVPITPWTPQQARARDGRHARAPSPTEVVLAYAPGNDLNPAGSAGRIRNGTTGVYGWGRGGPFSGTTRGLDLVPDGVAKVEYVLPRQPGGAQYGEPTYPRTGLVDVTVRGNIAAYQTRRTLGRGEASVWYAADGQVIRRFGSIAAAERVVPVRRPGPETAQSLGAERDPSSPNRVWVTPRVGGPTTVFTLHFRTLLNQADYGFGFSGTRCRDDDGFPGGIGRDPSGAQVLRGQLLNDPLNGAGYCRGTYHLAVRVTGLEPLGTLRPVGRRVRAQPFGSATFTVR